MATKYVPIKIAQRDLCSLVDDPDLIAITRHDTLVAGLVGPRQLQLIRCVEAADDLEKLLAQYPDIP